MKEYIKKLIAIVLMVLINSIPLPFFSVQAAPVMDNDEGTYTDDFANNSGMPTRSYVNVNTGTGVLQLTNESN